jgi:hypothetical protein
MRFFLLAPVDRRREIYRHVAVVVPQIGAWTAGAMTPFILLDPDMGSAPIGYRGGPGARMCFLRRNKVAGKRKAIQRFPGRR